MTKKHLVTAAAALAVALFTFLPAPMAAESHESAAADSHQYAIDAGHTSVGFSVRHFTVSNVYGRFGEVAGTIQYDPEDLGSSGVDVTIAAASIDTDHEQRDDHLKSADFLDVEKHPQISFKGSEVERTDTGMAVTGDLTIRGVSKQVTIPFEMAGPIKDPMGMMRMGIEGQLTIDRRDFGLEWNKVMETGGLFVGHDVKITLAAEAVRR